MPLSYGAFLDRVDLSADLEFLPPQAYRERVDPSPSDASHRRSVTTLTTVVVIAVGLLAGCSGGPGALPTPSATRTSEPTPEASAPPEIDFANTEWLFRPGGSEVQTLTIPIIGGTATVGNVVYTVGETVESDATGDGRPDAAVQITGTQGRTIDQQWYLWIATDEGLVQSEMPFAQTALCGTTTHSVTAAADGFQVEETRRTIGEEQLPCTEGGSDVRTRIVTALPLSDGDAWWPSQPAPVAGFGGLCPVPAEWETSSYTGAIHTLPDDDSPEVSGGAQVQVFGVASWPVYTDIPGWQLVGMKSAETMSCAWMKLG